MLGLAGGHQLGGVHLDVFPGDSRISAQGCVDHVLCWAAKDFTSELCDLGKAQALSGLGCIVCEMRGQV